MKKIEVKELVRVMDRSYPEKGIGIIKDVKKTIFTVEFNDKVEKWDFPHAQFLEKV